MNTDGRREGDITDIVYVIGTKCARLARMYYKGLLARTMLLKKASRYDEGSRGLAMVVETGRMPGQPADYPNVVVCALIQPLIPAPFSAQPNPIHPSGGRRELRDDADEFLRRFPDRAREGREASCLTKHSFLCSELHKISPKLHRRKQAGAMSPAG